MSVIFCNACYNHNRWNCICMETQSHPERDYGSLLPPMSAWLGYEFLKDDVKFALLWHSSSSIDLPVRDRVGDLIEALDGSEVYAEVLYTAKQVENLEALCMLYGEGANLHPNKEPLSAWAVWYNEVDSRVSPYYERLCNIPGDCERQLPKYEIAARIIQKYCWIRYHTLVTQPSEIERLIEPRRILNKIN